MVYDFAFDILEILIITLAIFMALTFVMVVMVTLRQEVLPGLYTWEESEDLSEHGRAFFDTADGELGAAGFRPVGTYVLPEMPALCELRVYLSSDALVTVQALSIELQSRVLKNARETGYIIHSYFEDGHWLATTDMSSLPWDNPDWLSGSAVDKSAGVQAMLGHHRVRLDALVAEGHKPVKIKASKLKELNDKVEAGFFEHQHGNGLIKPKEEGRYGLTFKIALRCLANAFVSGGKRTGPRPLKAKELSFPRPSAS